LKAYCVVSVREGRLAVMCVGGSGARTKPLYCGTAFDNNLMQGDTDNCSTRLWLMPKAATPLQYEDTVEGEVADASTVHVRRSLHLDYHPLR
jgi:hypothetical protein